MSSRPSHRRNGLLLAFIDAFPKAKSCNHSLKDVSYRSSEPLNRKRVTNVPVACLARVCGWPWPLAYYGITFVRFMAVPSCYRDDD